jgi:glyoxylase-like metal-dependent hydrolase (beta-lactamase superfamily II)
MEIQTLPVGQLQTNCYLVSDLVTNQCLIIDPGDEANFISEKILRQNLKPQAIIATHGHFDHVLAAYELQMAFEIPFMLHPDDKQLLSRSTDSASYWTNREIVVKPPKVNKEINQGDKIQVGDSQLEVLATPGHTPGGITLYNSQEKIAFVGDTLFKDGVGRTDFKYASSQQLWQSIEKIKAKLNGFTAYPGHGQEFILRK